MPPMPQSDQIVANNIEEAHVLNDRALSNSTGGPPVSMFHVTPRKQSLSAFKSIFDDQKLSKKIEKVKFTTSKDPDRSWNPRDKNSVLSEEYGNAIKAISKLANLQAVELQFSANCGVESERDGWWHPETEELVEFRLEVLNEFFSALNEQSPSKLQSLSIENLQNLNDKELTTSANFISELSQLTELRLKIVTEYFEHCPEQVWEVPEMYNFFTELPDVWLKPVSANIESLTLQADVHWGYLPKSDLRKVHFPKLQKLELGNYTFSHDWQIEWILSHGETLEELILHDCPIISYSTGYGLIDEERYPSDQISYSAEEQYSWEYNQKWSFVFTQLQEKLPKLRYFKFGDTDFNREDPERLGLTEKSYMACDRGIADPWTYIDVYVYEAENWIHPDTFTATDRREEYRVDDEKAYQDLMNTVKCRADGI